MLNPANILPALLLTAATPAFAQMDEALRLKQDLDFDKLEWANPWIGSTNASGMTTILKTLPNYTSFSDISLRGDYETGEFGDPFTPDQYTNIGLQTKSIQRLGNTFVMGYFNYDLSHRIGAQWNGLFVTGSNPFFIADSTKGTFRSEAFSAGVQVAHPIGKNQAIGFSIDYITATGAKDKDLRNQNIYNNFVIRPAWTIDIDNLTIGFSAGYNRTMENINYRNIQTQESKIFFTFYGNWFMQSEIFATGSQSLRIKIDNAFDGQLQLQYTGKNYAIYNEFGAELSKGFQRNLAINNMQFGDVEYVLLKNNLVAHAFKNHRLAVDFRHKTTLGYRVLQIDEIDIASNQRFWTICDRINLYAATGSRQSFTYSFLMHRDNVMDISWQADAGATFFQREQAYRIYPFEFLQTASTTEIFAAFAKNLKFGKSTIDIRPLMAYGMGFGEKQKMENHAPELGMEPDDDWQLTAQMEHEFYALTCDKLRAQIRLKYAYAFGNRGNRAFIFANYDYVQPLDNHNDLFNDMTRNYITVGVGLSF